MSDSDRKQESHHEVKLTKRELEVLTLVTEGKTFVDIADALCISKRTVDCHLVNIYGKLQVSNRIQAFRRATRLGLIPPNTELSKQSQP